MGGDGEEPLGIRSRGRRGREEEQGRHKSFDYLVRGGLSPDQSQLMTSAGTNKDLKSEGEYSAAAAPDSTMTKHVVHEH